MGTLGTCGGRESKIHTCCARALSNVEATLSARNQVPPIGPTHRRTPCIRSSMGVPATPEVWAAARSHSGRRRGRDQRKTGDGGVFWEPKGPVLEQAHHGCSGRVRIALGVIRGHLKQLAHPRPPPAPSLVAGEVSICAGISHPEAEHISTFPHPEAGSESPLRSIIYTSGCLGGLSLIHI